MFITIYIIKGSAYTKIIAYYEDRMSHLYITHTGVRNAREGSDVKRRVLAREQAEYKGSKYACREESGSKRRNVKKARLRQGSHATKDVQHK